MRRDKAQHKEMLNALLKNYRSDINDQAVNVEESNEWSEDKK
jgi:hypothetical protein